MNKSIFYKFDENNLFFFCGSGISYNSYLPSAATILQKTCENFLPSDINQKELYKIINSIQPEIFYEQLLKITNDHRCLDLWKCFHGNYNHSKPNEEHIFIAYYSYLNGVPIFTTNFDLMFEDAARLLKIDYQVLLADDDPPIDSKKLSICKLHGSIADSEGNVSINTLFTTMTKISQINTKWIDFITNLMERKNLCFVGYSGRDLDYFPFFEKKSHDDSSFPIVWINDFDQCKTSSYKANSCNAVKINYYPSQYFPNFIKNNRQYSTLTSIFNENQNNNTDEIESFNKKTIESLSNKIKLINLINDKEKILFYAMLLHNMGDFNSAYSILTKLEINYFNDNSRLLYLQHLAQLNHEIGRYESCLKVSKQLHKEGKSDKSYKIISLCLSSESLRMLIPNDIYFKYNKNLYKKILFSMASLNAIINFSLTYIKIFFLLKINKDNQISIGAKHEFIEHKIRFLSIFQIIFLKIFNRFDKIRLGRNLLIYCWDRLYKESYHIGYASGLANTQKFQLRLDKKTDEKRNKISQAREIYKMTTSSTGIEILLHSQADIELNDGNYLKASELFKKCIIHSRNSGNILNQIKAYIGLAYSNEKGNITPCLTLVELQCFKDLIHKCEGNLWKDYFHELLKYFEKHKG